MLIIIINLLDCPGNYQYEKQPPTNFTHCNPVMTSLILTCSVLVPSDSTTVTVDWYWSKNINECGRNITEEQGKFTINTNRGSSHLPNVDRITTDLTITSPQTDTGYYWCQVNDPSYNGVFISSNKAPVFDTGTMTICSGQQYVIMTTCAITSNINTPNFLMCFISTQTVFPSMYNNMLTSSYSKTAMSISNIKSMSSTVTITVTTVSGTTSKKILESVTNLNSTKADHLLDSTSTEMYTTTSLITTSIILTINSTNYMNTVANTTLNHKSGIATVRGSTSSYSNASNPSLILLNTVMHFKNSIITTTVSTPVYDDAAVPFTINNTTLIISMSLVILLIISMLSCGVIVVIVIIKRKKTYKTNNGK